MRKESESTEGRLAELVTTRFWLLASVGPSEGQTSKCIGRASLVTTEGGILKSALLLAAGMVGISKLACWPMDNLQLCHHCCLLWVFGASTRGAKDKGWLTSPR